MEKSKKSSTSFALVLVAIAAVVLTSCRDSGIEDSPQFLYENGRDAQALIVAKQKLDTKHDLPARLFIVDYYLARHMETGEKSYADQAVRYWPGFEHIPDRSRGHAVYEEMAWLGRYFDVALLVLARNDVEGGRALLDRYCPQTSRADKSRCHRQHLGYFERQADAGITRLYQEMMFVVESALGIAYGDSGFTGDALRHLVGYDMDEASRRSQAYAERNDWNDEVMHHYCRAVGGNMPATRSARFNSYSAAFEQANCRTYMALIEADAEAVPQEPRSPSRDRDAARR